jgi:nitrate reductase gamma subunit
MRALHALIAVAVLFGAVYLGAEIAGQHFLFGVVLPYLGMVVFLVGLVYRVLKWAGAPVPFRIPTPCGQAKSLPFFKQSKLESPSSTLQVVGRMALEVLLFRSLFRNTSAELTPSKRLSYQSDKLLWAGALLFHWSFLVIFIRHLRFFLEPTPRLIGFIEHWDGFFQLAVPTLLMTDVAIVVALTYLLVRRLLNSQLRYISLAADYFALFVLLTVAVSGIFMRYFTKVDLVAVKQLCIGLVTFSPVVPSGVGFPFYLHVFFVSLLFAYFPFSKLMHMGGVFLSPTRNLANNNRMRRHQNPWEAELNARAHGHTYQEWEDEFREKLKASGYALDKE